MKRASTFGMKVEQLRELFDVGRELPRKPKEAGDEAKQDLLESRLAQNLPLDKRQVEQLPEALSLLCEAMGQLTGDVLGEILQDPSSDLTTTRRVKRRAKQWAAKAASKEEHDTAAAIYYAAIAHALVYHNQRITRFPVAALAETYARLSKETWMPQDLVALFQAARACCLKKEVSG